MQLLQVGLERYQRDLGLVECVCNLKEYMCMRGSLDDHTLSDRSGLFVGRKFDSPYYVVHLPYLGHNARKIVLDKYFDEIVRAIS